MILPILIGILVVICTYLYIKRTLNTQVWKKKGISYVPAKSLLSMFTTVWKSSIFEAHVALFKHFPNERYFGGYQLDKPLLVLKDPELIKRVMIKDFDFFVNHNTFVPDNIDPIWSRFLLGARGEKWKKLRSCMTPAFTGSKMRIIAVIMEDCAKNLVKHFNSKEEDTIQVELKDMFRRYTCDVIGHSAFGIRCNSFEDPNNDFYRQGTKASDFQGEIGLRFMLYMFFNDIAAWFKVHLFPPKVRLFFVNLIKETVKARAKGEFARKDMLQLLIDTNKEVFEKFDKDDIVSPGKNETEITADDLVAQAFGFFLAGFESTAGALSFIGYEVAINQEVQQKLRDEVDRVDADSEGKIDYETLQKGMKYLEMVIMEGLRKWPTIPMTDREVLKEYKIPAERPGEVDLVLEPGLSVLINSCGLQRDPDFYPEPEKFDPERFNEENRKKMKQCTFLTFGEGPRGCIGNRFAMLEMKMVLYLIIKNFEIVPTEKSEIPVVLHKTHPTIGAANGFHFALKKRILN